MKIKQFKMIIREVVREEIRLGLKEIIGELNQPTKTQPQLKKNVVEKKQYSSNSVLNDVLNETAAGDEWKTLGGGKLNSSDINNVISQNYGEMMNNNSNTPLSVDGQTADFLNKDYRKLMKAVDKKQGKI
tara:strand:- start:1737 stop:2126 length:390 start_codon:yes stop_codon:yes gene_type:complete